MAAFANTEDFLCSKCIFLKETFYICFYRGRGQVNFFIVLKDTKKTVDFKSSLRPK